MRVKSRGSYPAAQHGSFESNVVDTVTSGKVPESILAPSSDVVNRVVVVMTCSVHTLSSKVYSDLSIDSD